MTGSVKPSYRRQQAEATRGRIAAAARALFAEHGYGVTSIESIAGAAGVAVRTVYSAFGSKREILSQICEDWLEQANARPLAERVLAEPDPQARVRGAAAWLTNLYDSGFDVVTIFEGATDESAKTRELLRAKLAGRDQVLDAMVASLAPVLPAGVPRSQAVLRALAAPGVYRALRIEAGWSADDFTDWIAAALTAR
ncbi:TetR/AcrR family transcriptional regulator [Nakamurella lactea]|uniref:TetR/AcrR family transcriptional regulator n=1 Tax=Nakamurella lactea TaxID=459515 RepID=UPI0003F51D06|nr:TetR/AcrR family transcriptional regulator [Nakamurella lactea]